MGAKVKHEMSSDPHYRLLEGIYARANCNIHFCPGLAMTVSHGRADITLPMRPEFFHAGQAVHGFVYFKMLDEAAFFAANSLIEDLFVLTSNFHLNLVRPITTGTMRASGVVVHAGKNQIIADATLYNDSGKLLARGTGTFVRSQIALADLAHPPGTTGKDHQ